ncbi:MAG: glycine--tRNA ligase [Thermoproteota archaeon]
MTDKIDFNRIVDIAKRRGIIYPSSEIYGGLSGFFDYGPVGFLLKEKIVKFWREFFLSPEDNIFEVETCTIMSEQVFRASGHLRDFIDPSTQCKRCNSIFRADTLIEETTGQFVEGAEAGELSKIIAEKQIRCPKCGGELSETKIFHLMLYTNVGPVEGNLAYLRPETAQGIFVNFRNILTATRAKLPFGVAQVGTSYRNEISPRQWLMRLREFRQMEIEMFINPKKLDHCPSFEKVSKVKIRILSRDAQKSNQEPTELTAEEAAKFMPKFQAYFMAKEFLWYRLLGIPEEAIRFRHMLQKETPHYSKGNFDMEIKYDFGWKEVVGNAYRTDFDLKTHMENSGKDLTCTEDGEKILPHVVEPSFGIDRTIYAVLLYCYRDDGRGWEWFALPPKISPYLCAVLPLVSKDGIPEKAREIYDVLRHEFDVLFDQSGSIGRRYARCDEIGVPFCITCDYRTLEDETVTIRNRDDCSQIRTDSKTLSLTLRKLIEGQIQFSEAGARVE